MQCILLEIIRGTSVINTTFIRADIDECALGITVCSHICTNTYGSFLCDCYIGYKISSDNRTCVGELTQPVILNFYVAFINHEDIQLQTV